MLKPHGATCTLRPYFTQTGAYVAHTTCRVNTCVQLCTIAICAIWVSKVGPTDSGNRGVPPHQILVNISHLSPEGRARPLRSLVSKIYRINVDLTQPYKSPSQNRFHWTGSVPLASISLVGIVGDSKVTYSTVCS